METSSRNDNQISKRFYKRKRRKKNKAALIEMKVLLEETRVIKLKTLYADFVWFVWFGLSRVRERERRERELKLESIKSRDVKNGEKDS